MREQLSPLIRFKVWRMDQQIKIASLAGNDENVTHLLQQRDELLSQFPALARRRQQRWEETQRRARERYNKDPGSARRGSIRYQDVSLLSLWIHRQRLHRPYNPAFSWHGLARWILVVFGVFLIGLIGQVVWMWQTLAVTDQDLWLWELAYIAPAPARYWLVVQQLQQPIDILLFILAFGSWLVLTVLHAKHRVTRIWLGASQLWLLLIVAMACGLVIGRAFLYERAKASGAMNDGTPGNTLNLFIDINNGLDQNAQPSYRLALSQSDGALAMGIKIAVFVVIAGLAVILTLTVKRMPHWLTMTTKLAQYATAIGLIGIVLVRQGFSGIMSPIVILALAFVWLPGELRTIRYCIDEQIDSSNEWHAAFDLVFCLAVILMFALLTELA